MGIDFANLPKHISLAVSQKTELKDFVRLSKASKAANNITSLVKTRMTWDVPVLHVCHQRFTLPNIFSGDDNGSLKFSLLVEDMYILNYYLDDNQCELVINNLKPLSATVRRLHLINVVCSTDNFNMLLKNLLKESLRWMRWKNR